VEGLGVEDGFEAVQVPEFGLEEGGGDVPVVFFVGDAVHGPVLLGGFEVGLEGIVDAFDDGEVIECEGTGSVDREGAGADAGFVLGQILLAWEGEWEGHGEMWVGSL